MDGWLPWTFVVALCLALPSVTYSRAVAAQQSERATLAEAERLRARVTELYRDGDYRAAVPLAERALAIDERHLGSDHETVGLDASLLGAVLQAAGDYERALPQHERALAINEKVHGPDHPSGAVYLNNLAAIYRAKGDYARAAPLFERALAINEKARGPEHPRVGHGLANLGELYDAKGEYERAEPLYKRALAIFEKVHGADHMSVALGLNNLAKLYDARGEYARAQPLFERSLAIIEKVRGPEHPRVAVPLTNLAAIHEIMGDYAQAERLHTRALAIKDKALGSGHPSFAVGLSNLAMLHKAKGDFARAEALYQRALAIEEKALGSDHPIVARGLNNLANLHVSKGDHARALPLHERALRIRQHSLGPGHPQVAMSLNNLAVIHKAMGDAARAAALYQRALRINEKALGSSHPEVATNLNNLAVLHAAKGDYAGAEALHERALHIREQALGADHPSVAASLANLAALYDAKGDPSRAIDSHRRGTEVGERVLAAIVQAGTEAQKRAYFATLRGNTNFAVSLHVRSAPGDLGAAELALTTLLRRKGRVLDATSDTLRQLRRRAAPADEVELQKLATLRTELSTRTLRGPRKLSAARHRERLAQLEARARSVEEELGARYAELRVESQPVTVASVQARLASGQALVEIAVFEPYDAKVAKPDDRWGKPHYVAYVLQPTAAPRWVELGEVAAIDALVHATRALLADGDAGCARAARDLDELVMRPIRALLGPSRDILISPDGALNLVPFAALIDEHDRFLVSQFRFTYLTSGRDLLRSRDGVEPRQPPLVVGNPSYGGGAATAAAPDARAARSVDMSTIWFSALPGTGQEASALAGIVPGARILTQAKATEAALKAARGPRILHVATHGFFLMDSDETAAHRARRALKLVASTAHDLPTAPPLESPLLRSGLALAGANDRNGGQEDGILTAMEMVGIDLYGTKLVTLSACETGIGEVATGEGVYGMRRALVLAGAETQVMSLWKVDDVATRDLMAAYYRHLRDGEGRSRAMRQVQLAMLADPQTAHPSYWAAFIVSGDQRSLDGKPVAPVQPSEAGANAAAALGKVRPSSRGCACQLPGGRSDALWGWLVALAATALLGARRWGSCAGWMPPLPAAPRLPLSPPLAPRWASAIAATAMRRRCRTHR